MNCAVRYHIVVQPAVSYGMAVMHAMHQNTLALGHPIFDVENFMVIFMVKEILVIFKE